MASLQHSLDAEDFRKKLRYIMEELGFTQAKLAAMDGVSASYLSDVMSGRRDPGKKLLAAHGMVKRIYYEYE